MQVINFDCVEYKSVGYLYAAVACVLCPPWRFWLNVVQKFIEAPQSCQDLTIWTDLGHYSLAPALQPVALINKIFFVVEATYSMHLVVLEISLIFFSVGPNHASFTRFFIMQPRSFISLLPFPTVLSLTLQLIVHEFSLVVTSVFKLKLPKTVFLALAPHSSVSFAISKYLTSFSFLLTIKPASTVNRSIVGVILSLSKCLVILKQPNIALSITKSQNTVSFHIVCLPLSFILRTIFPYIYAFSMPHSFHPLSLVGRPINIFYPFLQFFRKYLL